MHATLTASGVSAVDRTARQPTGTHLRLIINAAVRSQISPRASGCLSRPYNGSGYNLLIGSACYHTTCSPTISDEVGRICSSPWTVASSSPLWRWPPSFLRVRLPMRSRLPPPRLPPRPPRRAATGQTAPSRQPSVLRSARIGKSLRD